MSPILFILLHNNCYTFRTSGLIYPFLLVTIRQLDNIMSNDTNIQLCQSLGKSFYSTCVLLEYPTTGPEIL